MLFMSKLHVRIWTTDELIDNTCGILIDAIPSECDISGFTYNRSFYVSEESLKK